MNEPDVQVAPRDNPYFGLEYYDEKFGAWFFGREAEGSKIITNLRAARLTLLHAESGVGKSSLLRAGVAWRMRKLADDMFARRRSVRSVPVVFTSWKDDPCRELTECVGAAIKPYLGDRPVPPLSADHLDLAIEAASQAVNGSLLIMLDQFEEYFLYRSREPVPERFADELARCLNRTDLRANFLIAIREDAYAGLGDLFKGRIPNVYGNYLHIDYLDRASAERAIREPLDVYNRQRGASEQVRVHDDLVEAVLDDVRTFDYTTDARPGQQSSANGNGEIRIATPLLQLVMEQVWNAERDDGSRELRLATLQKLHGVKMIADAHLGKALDLLGHAERRTAIDIFDHLVTPSGGKIAESVSDLAMRTGHSEEQVSMVLAKLDHERIVRPVPAAPGQDPLRFRRYEIFHDVLAPTINRAITAREAQRRVRRTRRFTALALVLLVVVSAIAVTFAHLLSNADNEKLAAESRQLAAEAFLAASRSPDLSAQLAAQALRLRYTPQAEDALRAALPGLQTVQTIQDGLTVYAAAFDPADDDKVAGADFAGMASIWDVKTGRRLVQMSLGGFQATGVAATLAFNPSGTELAVGYADGDVALFDTSTGKKVLSATDGSQPVNQVQFIGNSGRLAIASAENLAVWQYAKGTKCCNVLSSEPATTVVVSPRDPQELMAALPTSISVFELASAGGVRRQVLTSVAANDAEFNADGSKVAVAKENGAVDIYDIAARKTISTMSAGDPAAITAAFSPDGHLVVAGYGSGVTRVWDVATGLPLTQLAGSTAVVVAAQFDAGNDKVVTASGDGTIRIWYARPRELRTQFTSLSPDGSPAPVVGADYIGNRIITLDQNQQVEVFTPDGQRQAVISRNKPIWSMDWDQDGSKVVTTTADGRVELWNAAGSAYRQATPPSPIELKTHAATIAMSPDGSRFAVVTGDSIADGYSIQVRSTKTGRLLRTLDATNAIGYVALSPNGQQIIGADFLGQVEVWDGTTTSPSILGAPSPLLNTVRYSRDGTKFVTASEDGAVDVWSARDLRLIKRIDAPSPSTAAFSANGSMVVVACGDGTVRVFDAVTGKTLTALKPSSAGVVTDAGFSPDMKSIVASVDAGNTGYVQVWNAELATSSLVTVEQIADQRVRRLTPTQQQRYLNSFGD